MSLPSLADQIYAAGIAWQREHEAERRLERRVRFRHAPGDGPTMRDRLLQMFSDGRERLLRDILAAMPGANPSRVNAVLVSLMAERRIERLGRRNLYRYRLA